jgi:hypothetical protein
MEKINKICSKCGNEKEISEFNKRKNSKDGYRPDCRECQKLHYQNKREHYTHKMKENRATKIDEYRERDRKYYKNNKEDILKHKKEYYQQNKDSIIEYKKGYYLVNKNHKSDYSKKYYLKNKEKLIEYHRCYSRYYRNKNPHIITWRRILYSSLYRMKQTKNTNTFELLGYTADKLRSHLESLFTDGMSWDNYGEWHVDHIKPLSSFDPETHPSIVNALSNLQPLWATTREINGVIYEGNLNKHKKFTF